MVRDCAREVYGRTANWEICQQEDFGPITNAMAFACMRSVDMILALSQKNVSRGVSSIVYEALRACSHSYLWQPSFCGIRFGPQHCSTLVVFLEGGAEAMRSGGSSYFGKQELCAGRSLASESAWEKLGFYGRWSELVRRWLLGGPDGSDPLRRRSFSDRLGLKRWPEARRERFGFQSTHYSRNGW